MSDLRTAARQALEAHANRYQVVRDGYWWRVKIGDGTQTVGQHHTETGALRLASELHRAFHDGGFVVQEALRAALEQPEQEPVACPHRDEPRGCYRVRCQLGRKCVEPLYTRPPRREWPKFTLSCGCPSQYGGVPAYWDRDGSTAFGMICERHWHEYGARSNA